MQILDDRQRALAAHSGAHIQLAVRPQRQVHGGVDHVAPDVALRIGHRQHGAQRAAALDLQRQAGAVALQGVAHQAAAGQSPAKGRRGHRQGVVNLAGTLHDSAAADGRRLHHAVRRNCSYDTIHDSHSFAEESRPRRSGVMVYFRMAEK